MITCCMVSLYIWMLFHLSSIISCFNLFVKQVTSNVTNQISLSSYSNTNRLFSNKICLKKTWGPQEIFSKQFYLRTITITRRICFNFFYHNDIIMLLFLNILLHNRSDHWVFKLELLTYISRVREIQSLQQSQNVCELNQYFFRISISQWNYPFELNFVWL